MDEWTHSDGKFLAARIVVDFQEYYGLVGWHIDICQNKEEEKEEDMDR
jgi:endo-beta-N-acetylglucosaminidase D